MWRNLLGLASGMVLVLWLYYGGVVSSYVRTLWPLGRQPAEQSLPLEIQRAESLLAQLSRAQDRLLCRQAELTVAIRQLEHQLQHDREELRRDRNWLRAQRDRWRQHEVSTSDNFATPSLAELAQRFRLYQERENLLRQREQLLALKRQICDAIAQERRQLQAELAELTARLEKLKAQFELVQLKESRSDNFESPEWHASVRRDVAERAELCDLLQRLEKRLEICQVQQQLHREMSTPVIRLDDGNDLLEAIDRHVNSP